MTNLTSENFSDEVNTSNRSSISFIPSKLKASQIDEFDLNGYKTKQKKIELLKKYIYILGIISSLIIIISEIICQNENENYSEFNFYIRVVDLIFINNLYKIRLISIKINGRRR